MNGPGGSGQLVNPRTLFSKKQTCNMRGPHKRRKNRPVFGSTFFNSLVDEVGDLQIPEMALCKGVCMEPARCGGASL